MKKRNILISLLLISVAIGVTQVAFYYPRLPNVVATHFNASGVADGFSSKRTFAIGMVGLQSGLALVFLGLSWLLRVLPITTLNIPNRTYWMAPERRETTKSEVACFLLSVGLGTQWFFIATRQLIILHNLGWPAMQWIWAFLILFLCHVLGVVILLCLRFRVPAHVTEGENTQPDTSNLE